MLSINDLLAPFSRDDARAKLVRMLVAMGVPADQWRTGGVLSTILTIVAISYAGFSTLIVNAISAGFLPTASGGWLTLLAYYVYGVQRTEATYASGGFTLVNTGGGIYTHAAGEVIFLNSRTGKSYTNVAPFTIGSGTPATPTSLTITIQATDPGAASSSDPGAIDTIVTPMLGVAGTNALAVSGLDAQPDNELRTMCLNKLGSLSVRGPRTAYKYAVGVAKRLDGTPVNVNRSTVSPSSHTGTVTVTLASPSGAPTTADIAAVAASIESLARPDGITVIVQPATPVLYAPATLTVWGQAAAGLATADVATAVVSAIDTFLKSYPIGGLATTTAQGVFKTGIEGVCKAAHPSIFAVDGAIDLPLVGGQVATDGVTASNVTVRLVSPP